MKTTALSLIALAALMSTANAADLYANDDHELRRYASPGFHWSGFYVGVQGGGAWVHDDATASYAGVTSPSVTKDFQGGFGGVHLGYNFVNGNFLVGPELDFEGAGLKGTLDASASILGLPYSGSASASIASQGSARLRAGVIVSRTLFYATGGVAVADVKDTYSATLPAGNPLNIAAGTYSEAFSSTRWGWTLGGGIEHALSDHLTARVEYRYADFGSHTDTSSILPGATAEQKLTEQNVRVGVSAKF